MALWWMRAACLPSSMMTSRAPRLTPNASGPRSARASRRETLSSTAAARIASLKRRARRTWMIARASTGSRRRRIMLETCGRTRLSSKRESAASVSTARRRTLRAGCARHPATERAKGSFARCSRLRASSPKVKTRRARRLACASAGSSGASGLAESSRTISVARSAVSSRASSQARALVAAPAPSAPAPAETSREVWY